MLTKFWASLEPGMLHLHGICHQDASPYVLPGRAFVVGCGYLLFEVVVFTCQSHTLCSHLERKLKTDSHAV